MKMSAFYDDSGDVLSFQQGDSVRNQDNDERCVIIGIWRDLLWLDPIEFVDSAPFTGSPRLRTRQADLRVMPRDAAETLRLPFCDAKSKPGSIIRAKESCVRVRACCAVIPG
jgi:hypothetical protein